MKLIQKYGKKKIYIFSSILAVMCIIIGISTWYIMEQNYKQKVLDSIGITFIEEASIEYGTEKVDYNTFIKEKTGEPEIQLPTEEINTKELGKKQITYVLSKDGYSKTDILEVEIKDTVAPEIIFTSETLELTEGDEFDPESNIESVKDPVDGDIEKSDDEALEKSGYLVKSDVDTTTPSEYKVTITAYDINGNKSEKEYTVTVNEKEEVQQPKQPSNTGNSGGGNTANSGNPSGNPSSNTGESTTPAEPRYRTDISSSYVAQINAYRQQNGYPILPVTAEAQAEANKRAMELVTYYSHDGCGSGFTENIGMGDINYDFFIGWKNSSIHNSTMLDDWYSSFAVSVIEYNGKWYAVTSFRITY